MQVQPIVTEPQWVSLLDVALSQIIEPMITIAQQLETSTQVNLCNGDNAQHVSSELAIYAATLRDLAAKSCSIITASHSLTLPASSQASDDLHIQPELRQREQEFKTLVDNMPEMISRFDRQHRCVYANRAIESIMGVPAATAIGKTFQELGCSDAVVQRWRMALDQVIVTRREVMIEDELPISRDTPCYQTRIVPEFAADGSVATVLAIARDISDRKREDAALRMLVQGTATVTNEDFLAVLVETLGTALNVRHALVSERMDDHLQTLAFWSDRELRSNIAYRFMDHACCRSSLEQGVFCVPSGVRQQFPDDPILVDLDAESYLGVALLGSDGRVLGNLCVVNDQPIADTLRAESFLRIFAARAAAELERQQAMTALHTLNQELEQRVRDRTQALERSQASLQQQEREFRTLVENLPDVVARVDRHLHHLYINPIVEQETGIAPEAYIGKTLHELNLPESSITPVETLLSQVFETQTSGWLDFTTATPQGEQFYQIHAVPELGGDRSVISVLSITRNVTQLKQTEAKLQQSQQELAAIMDHSPMLVYLVDRDNRYLAVNQTYEAVVSTPRRDIIGKQIDEIWPIEIAQNFLVNIQKVRDLGRPIEFEESACVDGKHHTYLTIKFPLYDTSGVLYAVGGICTDISDRKDAETQLQHMNERQALINAELARATRLKDEFLANMSHELRTPLNCIMGMAEGLVSGIFGTLSARQQRSIDLIYSSSHHLLALINDILDVAKIEAGKVELDQMPVLIEELCQASVAFIAQQAQQKQIHLTCSFAVAGTIEVDGRRLQQVLINLLSNAVKFTPDGGCVTFVAEVDTQADELRFSITDTGIGIAPADQEKLFQTFVQLDSNLSRRYEGTGLGLVLVKQITELHGGRVEVASEVGQGSCFTVVLPWQPTESIVCLSSDPVLQSSESLASETDDTPISLLLAEDNPDNIATFTDYLQAKGFQMAIAQNGIEAIQMAKQQRPHLILMDIQMPEMDGLTAIQHLRQDPETATIPIIALTALAMPGDKERCLDAGATDYVTKPVQLAHLVRLIQTLVMTVRV